MAADDDEDRAVAALSAARDALRAGINKSRALSAAVARAAPGISSIQRRLASARPIRASPEVLAASGSHIDRAVGPAAAVLKVFDAVHGIEPPLLAGPGADLRGYLAALAQLEAACGFLPENCALAVHWLDDIVEYLGDSELADPGYLGSLSRTLDGLKNAPPEPSQLDGGLLAAALDKLEDEFRILLTEHCTPLPMPESSNSVNPQSNSVSISPAKVPLNVVGKLSAILSRLAVNGRLENCVTAYAEARGETVAAGLKALGLEYLETPTSDVRSLGPTVELWGRHLEFAVRHLLESERKLCVQVFDGRPDDGARCFAEIASQAGILQFIKFGCAIADAKGVPVKLLRLLDVFDALNKLRLDFNRLFGGKACADIQSQTRDLIKRVVDGVAEIFDELQVQVEKQRQLPPPADSGVPHVVSFIPDFCNRLLSTKYRPALKQVLTIHRIWKKEPFQEKMLIDAILNIVKTLEANFESWSKGYEDTTQSYIFMMNIHWHFFKHLRGTALEELLGDAWLRVHEQYKDYYLAIFLRESWGSLPPLLNRDGLILFSKGRATARDLVKQRLKSFNEQFDEMQKRQSSWVILDKDLRERTCSLVIQTIVPVYRSYMQNYGPLVEQDPSASKYVKYSAESLEKILKSLYIPRPRRAASFQVRQSNGKVDSASTGLHRSASTMK